MDLLYNNISDNISDNIDDNISAITDDNLLDNADNKVITDYYKYKSIPNTKCMYCLSNSKAHSFSIHRNNNIATPYSVNSDNIIMFNTMISEADMYNRPYTIIYHIELELDNNNPDYLNTNWIWNIDFKNADLKHYLSFNTVKCLSQWINNENLGYCSNLREIRIYNANFLIKPLISLAYWFLPKHIKIVKIN